MKVLVLGATGDIRPARKSASPSLSKNEESDVIIDACNPGENGVVVPIDEVLAHAKSRGPHYKLKFIFTSVTWTHGEAIARLGYISERGPLINPLDLVKWRADTRRGILSAPTAEAAEVS
ncbi:hypothetical protein V1520DRAFT_324781 [Lipomyces starkeyi]|uniref:Uncharacterized protein n=1 Tax=Lipomyces starkeyi NRRL Y-11557 TaxID=675824 RepID=A0A1E3PVL0_LIPST|nr:hypothetical protein LIPSTDRAFT_114156 [Lipomyces starkeyi NRRL Y-11557]